MTMLPAAAPKRVARPDLRGIGFLLLGLLFGAAMIGLGNGIYQLQDAVSTLAGLVPLGYAFGAGMVAAVNPCGILLLPSAAAYYLATGDAAESSGGRRAARALQLAVLATLGFVAIFAVAGLIIGAGGRALAGAFPLGGFLVGLLLVGLGGRLALSGRPFGIAAAGGAMGRVHLGRDLRSPFLFGVAYAITSLACTLPIFLVVAASSLAAGGPLAAAVQFISYALGMGSVLTLVVLGAAFFEGGVRSWLRRVVPYVHRLSAAFLLGAGIFLVKYWLTTGGLFR